MAQLYTAYMIGSMTVAYLSNVIYNYSNSGIEKIEKNVISFDHIEEVIENNPQILYDKDNDGDSKETYNCIKCHKNLTLHNFSKNQQKKKPVNMWKCKTCTMSLT